MLNTNTLLSYVYAKIPIVYINHFDTHLIDSAISKINIGKLPILEFNNALGSIDFATKSPITDGEKTLEDFLKNALDEAFDKDLFIVLKDIHHKLDDPVVIALLKRISEFNLYDTEGRICTVFIVATKTVIPSEIENYITIFDVLNPDDAEVLQIIRDFYKNHNLPEDRSVISEIALSLKGLNEFQVKRILNLAYQNGGNLTAQDKELISNEKEQFLKKSGMLEIVNFKESIEEIGGLDYLKNWLTKKEKIYSRLDKAIKYGVDIPKGIMIVGMPGCGKSLTAKATASLFQTPLVRLDVGRLLGKYVGESEENMRKALKLAEEIAPCVLWIDEIEKAFSGGLEQGGDVTTRLFGQFLTWMQEKENSVFIVATANDISKIPAEFLRKGRFDELFFVDLPNEKERKKILEIHLNKRNKNFDIKLDEIAKKTEGYNGADLEAVIQDAIETAFIANKDEISDKDLLNSLKNINSISKTLKNKMDTLRKTITDLDITSAT